MLNTKLTLQKIDKFLKFYPSDKLLPKVVTLVANTNENKFDFTSFVKYGLVRCW